jgi:hypothetical protein
VRKVQSLWLRRYHSRLRHCILCLRSAKLGIGDSLHLIPRAKPHHVIYILASGKTPQNDRIGVAANLVAILTFASCLLHSSFQTLRM